MTAIALKTSSQIQCGSTSICAVTSPNTCVVAPAQFHNSSLADPHTLQAPAQTRAAALLEESTRFGVDQWRVVHFFLELILLCQARSWFCPMNRTLIDYWKLLEIIPRCTLGKVLVSQTWMCRASKLLYASACLPRVTHGRCTAVIRILVRDLFTWDPRYVMCAEPWPPLFSIIGI